MIIYPVTHALREVSLKRRNALFLNCKCKTIEMYTYDCNLEKRKINVIIRGYHAHREDIYDKLFSGSKNWMLLPITSDNPLYPKGQVKDKTAVHCVQCIKCKITFIFIYKGDVCKLGKALRK